MVFPKFIIQETLTEGNVLVVAKCKYHKELSSDVEKVKGGGWWTFDNESSTFTLYGESHDFGMAKLEDIADCVKRGKVYHRLNSKRNFITQGCKFIYKDVFGNCTSLG